MWIDTIAHFSSFYCFARHTAVHLLSVVKKTLSNKLVVSEYLSSSTTTTTIFQNDLGKPVSER